VCILLSALKLTWIDIAKRICPVKTWWKLLLEITILVGYIINVIVAVCVLVLFAAWRITEKLYCKNQVNIVSVLRAFFVSFLWATEQNTELQRIHFTFYYLSIRFVEVIKYLEQEAQLQQR